MFRSFAVLALVGSASAAAADYSSAEIGCTNAYNMVTCENLVTESLCTNPLCSWVVDGEDENCELAAGDDTLTAWDDDLTAAEAATSAADNVCYNSATTEAACTGDCTWNVEISKCFLGVAKAEELLDDAGANGGITAANMNAIFEDLTCVHIDATAAACDAVDGCTVMTMTDGGQTQSRCVASDAKKLATIEAKCDTAGSAALANAEAAAGISAANVAAPLMIVISGVVGALAIFA